MIAFTSIWGWAVAAQAVEHTWPEDVDVLVVDSSAGDVTLRPGARLGVVATKLRWDEDCELVFDDGGALRAGPEEGRTAECEVTLELTVPAGVEVRLGLGAGDVDVRGVRLEAEVGAGAVTGSVAGPLSVHVGAGRVELHDLTGAGSVTVGAGDITLGFSAAPRGTVTAEAGVGALALTLPDGAPVRFRGRAPRDVRVPVSAAAPTVLDLSTGVGAVQVR